MADSSSSGTAVRKEGEYFFLEGEGLQLCDLCKDATDTRRKEIIASLPVNSLSAPTKKRKTATTGEDGASAVTIMQAFAKAGKNDVESTDAQPNSAGETEESTDEDIQEVQGNPFDEDVQGVDDATISPPISTPVDRSPASTRPTHIDTDEEMEET